MRTLAIFLLLAGLGAADTITLRDGRTIDGSYLGGDARSVRIAVGDRVDSYPVEQIANIAFTTPAPPPAPPPPPDGPQLASGTKITIRTIDSIDSAKAYVGKTFRASLDEPVLDANGNTLIPRGADCLVKLIDDQESGKIAGRTVLTLSLFTLQANGHTVEINSKNITEQSSSRGARSGKVIGGGAAAGALIGAIAGGGKGAAIGAGAGAGAGTVAEVATKGQKVHIPSETRLTFTLDKPAQL